MLIDLLERRLVDLRAVQEAVDKLGAHISVEPELRLSAVSGLLSQAAAAQRRLRLCLEAEATAHKSNTEAREAIESAESEEKRLNGMLSRYVAANKALEEVQLEHSLQSASREALRSNRLQIADIFERIHAPHEFEVCDSEEAPLRRIDTKSPIQLDSISTGQRAAFALSLFLALNSRSILSPKVVLIDDPVAHVDDLNTLSFLDYLRELAIAGERQIFFSTADDKLASLFGHKFSFLGDQFKRYSLTR